MKKYQAWFIFEATISEEALETLLGRIREDVTRHGGTVDQVEKLGRRAFARPLRKREAGQYVKMQISMEPTSIAPFTARIKLNEDVFRMQIVVKPRVVRAVATPEETPANVQP